MTETCAGSIYSQNFDREHPSQEFASVGLPVEGMQLRVVTEQDALTSDGTVGDVQVRGSVVFAGYLNDAEATAAAFTSDGGSAPGTGACCATGG
jgi:long-subunit acyl-CoA synthetase (AMP-forming)